MDIESKFFAPLRKERERLDSIPIEELFKEDKQRFSQYSASIEDMFLDFSKTKVDDAVLELLLEMAEESGVEELRTAMFAGEKINTTENRSVLHTALRNKNGEPVLIDGVDIMDDIHDELQKMIAFSDDILSGEICAPNGKKFTDVVNIGIGGSGLGPLMGERALRLYNQGLKIHCVSTVDASNIVDRLAQLNAETTLFVISSKTFTTVETMTNATTAHKWMSEQFGAKANEHFVAVTSNIEGAGKFGIPPSRVFSYGDYVGGRYSLCGPVGLPLMLCVGSDNFIDFLEGAYEMDCHFKEAPMEENLPIIMALVDIWHINICGFTSRAILPYDERMKYFPSYVEQLEMESNGKRVSKDGEALSYQTSTVVWGATGINAQHSFFQMFHQGTQVIPCDFLLSAQNDAPNLQHHHDLLVANCLAQSETMMKQQSLAEATEILAKTRTQEEAQKLASHLVLENTHPTMTLLYKKLTPKTLGKIIALYEHRVFVQGCIWQINSFDQWGVEFGKKIANQVLEKLQSDEMFEQKATSTQGLLNVIKKWGSEEGC